MVVSRETYVTFAGGCTWRQFTPTMLSLPNLTVRLSASPRPRDAGRSFTSRSGRAAALSRSLAGGRGLFQQPAEDHDRILSGRPVARLAASGHVAGHGAGRRSDLRGSARPGLRARAEGLGSPGVAVAAAARRGVPARPAGPRPVA